MKTSNAYLLHSKHYRDTNGNTYSATQCLIGNDLALVIPRTYGAPEDQQHRILAKLIDNYGLKNIGTFGDLEQFLGATIYRITQKATAKEVREWGRN
jgi:hypothetical protein